MCNIEMKGSKKMRKSRRSSRLKRRSRKCWSGGAQVISPAPLGDTSMSASSKMNLGQGIDYASIHKNQHGGMAPVGTTGMLDDSLRATARIGVLDQSMGAIQGMSDQSGGARKSFTGAMKSKLKGVLNKIKSKLVGPKSYTRKFMKMMQKKRGGARGKKATKRRVTKRRGPKRGMNVHKKILKTLKNMRRRLGMRGGAATPLTGAADYSSPGMLLSPAAEARALGGMNPEWKLATDPNSFAPKM